jgi:hypothetical protein
MLLTGLDKFEGELPIIDMNFRKAVYPSGHIKFLLWKWSESDTILPGNKFTK